MYQQVLMGYENALDVNHLETRMVADRLAYLATLSAEHRDRQPTSPCLTASQVSGDNTLPSSLPESPRKRGMLFRILRRE
ncbi:hypothetical protein BDW67DRAFT_165827 [Aspergillus spinulosporus]